MLFTILTGAGVFNHDKGKAEAGTLSRRGLYPRIGRDSGEDDRIDTTRLKLLLKVGACKGAPMPLGDEDVAMLETGGRSDLRRCGRQRLIAQVGRLVDGELHGVVEIDAHVDDGSAMNAEGVGKSIGFFDDLCRSMRHWIHADDGILQVDEDKCGLFGVELEFCHGSSLLKIEDTLDFSCFIIRGCPRFRQIPFGSLRSRNARRAGWRVFWKRPRSSLSKSATKQPL